MVPIWILPAPLEHWREPHGADADIAAAGDEFAIAANAVGGDFAAAGIDVERAIDAAGFDGAIGSGHDDVFEAGGFDEDGGDDGTGGGGEDEGIALGFLADGIVLEDAARLALGARLDAEADGVLQVAGDAGLHGHGAVGVDAEAAGSRSGAMKLADKAIADRASRPPVGRRMAAAEVRDDDYAKKCRSTHSCP